MNPAHHRDLGDAELSARWDDDRDAFARDLLLLRRWRDGAADAGMQLLGHYKKLFYRVCLDHGVRDQDRIVEVLQELVVNLLQSLPELPERVERSFAGYFYWQARDAALRQRRVRATCDLPTDAVEPGDHRERVETWEAIEQCWKRLPPRESQVFELRYLQGMSLKETADVLGSNVNAVGQTIFRLSGKMRECLKRSGY